MLVQPTTARALASRQSATLATQAFDIDWMLYALLPGPRSIIIAYTKTEVAVPVEQANVIEVRAKTIERW